jgi:hypothetical protein
MRNAETVLGIIHNRSAVLEDTGEPGAPKGARPVRGGLRLASALKSAV